ncbi:MAG: U32 family peptidase [Bacteroidales bacterium]|nr:U32 family peptidase [Bacteroidales bacterium]
MAADIKPRPLELLAPARDVETAFAAIRHGADAVYIGGPAFGARSAAGNTIDDIQRVVDYAHIFGVRVYVTLNTIIYENELDDVRSLVAGLDRIGVDALIVQDMALLGMDIPPVDLHASTQCDGRTPAKVAALSAAGFSQIVLPREFSLDMIREAAAAAPSARLEVFVHGALCVSYSGDCQAGWVTQGRSANRGECPQICRLQYTLTDKDRRPVRLPDGSSATRHWLSLADMRRIDSLGLLADAGASSFKIEGRLKSTAYVKEVTAAYSQALDRLVASAPDRYVRASYGRVDLRFTPDTDACFNRGFTRYFLRPGDSVGISATRSPKWIGRPVGRLVASRPRYIVVSADTALHAGDGLGWFGDDGVFRGFRVNRVDDAGHIYPAPGSDIPSRPGTELYRNRDNDRDAMLARDDTSLRTIAVTAVLRMTSDRRPVIDLTDERGCSVTVASSVPCTDIARTPQTAARRGLMERLGDTVYRLDSLDDRCGDAFIPASLLTALRRQAIGALDRAWHIAYRRKRRIAGTLAPDAFAGLELTYHDNVANSMARDFYESHGAAVGQNALEVSPQTGELRVMTTRYCLRRELGACLKDPATRDRLPAGDLWLDAPLGRLRLHCDCAGCRMLVSIKKS